MHLQTFTGRRFSPLAPKVSDIVIEDIAHALSHLCRFGGHVQSFYSVAQHAVLVSHAVPPEVALWGLLHDGSEAYLVDVPSPLKRTAAMRGYVAVEALMQRTVYQAFGLEGEEPEAVHDADEGLLLLEAEALLPGGPGPWADEIRARRGHRLPNLTIQPVAPARAKAGFLRRFAALTGKAA